MKEVVTLRSGVKIPRVKKKDIDSGKYITRSTLMLMHLSPKGDPVAFDRNEDGTLIYYFDPNRVTETPPELWYRHVDDAQLADEGAASDRDRQKSTEEQEELWEIAKACRTSLQAIEQANALDGTSVPANTMLLIPM